MILVTFYSVSSALLLDKLLQKQGAASSVIPVPRELSSSCGYALETDGRSSSLIPFMDEEEIEWEAVYEHRDGYRLIQQSR